MNAAASCPPDVAAILATLGVSRETVIRLERYAATLIDWNERMNLVGAATLPELWTRHMLDSAQLLPRIAPQQRMVDLGSGAGFPGLVIAIAQPNRDHPVQLIEATAKKCAFLAEAAQQAGAEVVIHNVRIEALAAGQIGLFDVVSARAVAPLSALLPLAAPLLAPGGRCLFLKGRSLPAEMAALSRRLRFRSVALPSLTSEDGRIVEITGLRARGGKSN